MSTESDSLAERLTKPAPKLHCSFCGKIETDVKQLIGGPPCGGCKCAVFICNECVGLCNDILAEPERPERPEMSASATGSYSPATVNSAPGECP